MLTSLHAGRDTCSRPPFRLAAAPGSRLPAPRPAVPAATPKAAAVTVTGSGAHGAGSATGAGASAELGGGAGGGTLLPPLCARRTPGSRRRRLGPVPPRPGLAAGGGGAEGTCPGLRRGGQGWGGRGGRWRWSGGRDTCLCGKPGSSLAWWGHQEHCGVQAEEASAALPGDRGAGQLQSGHRCGGVRGHPRDGGTRRAGDNARTPVCGEGSWRRF